MLNWNLGYSSSIDSLPTETVAIPARDVPGEVQRIWHEAGKLPDYNYGDNYKEYLWCENVYWHYTTTFALEAKKGFDPFIRFEYLDYRYSIYINDELYADGEGMFTPITLPLSDAGELVKVRVVIHPCPKDPTGKPGTRDEARMSAKPAVSYGWDWHPRLVTAGISGKAEVIYLPCDRIRELDVSYEMSEALDAATVTMTANIDGNAGAKLSAKLIDTDGTVAAETESELTSCLGMKLPMTTFDLTIANPKLWWCARQGEQHRYTLVVSLLDESGNVLHTGERKIGFRRVKLVMNEGGYYMLNGTPVTRGLAPFTIELNGRKIFAKGTNFVCADIFLSKVTDELYHTLVKLAVEANMNIFRMWGGSPVYRDVFYDLCDEMGMMVWQEFPLSCNAYPDDKHYLSVLEVEAESLIKRLRTHPSIVMWCGGNELFNNWSGMNDQAHALRLLNKKTYDLDRNTPFTPTSPVAGVGHAPYVNIYDDATGKESIEIFNEVFRTAYTEFGCPGPSPIDYIRQYMDESDVQLVFDEEKRLETPWKTHHAFDAHQPIDTWFRLKEVEQYFYKPNTVEEAVDLAMTIQCACYRVMFEACRRRWPFTSMALNWCYNEPWPCFANNSLLVWPDIVKPCYFDVREALRDQMLSVKLPKLRHNAGDEIEIELWAYNDLPEALRGASFTLTLEYDGEDGKSIEIASGTFGEVAPTSVAKLASYKIQIPTDITKTFTIKAKCSNDALSSTYTLFRIG